MNSSGVSSNNEWLLFIYQPACRSLPSHHTPTPVNVNSWYRPRTPLALFCLPFHPSLLAHPHSLVSQFGPQKNSILAPQHLSSLGSRVGISNQITNTNPTKTKSRDTPDIILHMSRFQSKNTNMNSKESMTPPEANNPVDIGSGKDHLAEAQIRI